MRNRIGNAGLTAAISMALLAAFPVIAWAAPVLPAGITAGSQSLAGMTAEEAKAAVQEYVDGLAAQSVTLSVDGQDVATTAGELGFHWINTDAIDEAVSQYAGGSLIKQYMIEKDLAAAPVEVELETEVDSAKVKNFVDTQCQGITAEPQNASITRENGQFVITDSVPGRVVDVAGTVNPAYSDLPAFLTPHGGVCSGFMIVQYSAAALVSENKVLAHPASVDSIPSSAGQEDHVSMGTIAARKAGEIAKNVRRVLAMELMVACQGIDMRGNKGLGKGTQAAYDLVRKQVATLDDHRDLYGAINYCEEIIENGSLIKAVEEAIGQAIETR